jgi:immune inhibitor A
VAARERNPVFDDSQSYWSPQLPQAGVIVPRNGVRMEVTRIAGTSLTVHITG